MKPLQMLQFTHNGRTFEVRVETRYTSFMITVWEGARKVSPTDIFIDQRPVLEADARGEMETFFETEMQRVKHDVVSGHVTMLP